MKAIIYRAPWHLATEDRPEPGDPKGHQVVVRIRATGICGTDLGIISGQYHAKPSVILGHESAGDVVSVGPSVTTLTPGDRVVIDPTYYCGQCFMCRSGRQNHCELKNQTETGVSSDGTFTTHYVTEDRFLYRMSDHISYEEGSMTEPLSCTLTGIDQIRVRPEFRTVVIGAGPMGMLYSYALAAKGLSGGVVEISPERAKMAAGVVSTNWSVYPSLKEAALAISPRDCQLDVIVDTTGVMSSESMSVLSRGGRLLLVGLRDKAATFNPRDIVDRSLSVVGSIDSLGTFATAHYMIQSRVVPVKRLITEHFPLSDMELALSRLGCDLKSGAISASAQAIKVIVHP